MNYLAPKRLFGFAMAAIFMSVAGWAVIGVAHGVQEWRWLRNAVETDAKVLSYKHEHIATRRGSQRRTTFSYVYSLLMSMVDARLPPLFAC